MLASAKGFVSIVYMKIFFIVLLFLIGGCSTSPKPQQEQELSASVIKAYNEAMAPTEVVCQAHKDCKSGFRCSKIDKGVQRCVKVASPAPQTFALPFAPGSQIICTQNASYLDGSHSGPSTFYALDLTTPYDKPASKIIAAAAGTAYVFKDCPNQPGTNSSMKGDHCGRGWGNNVRIDHGNGIMSLYAHLSEVLVSNGEIVTAKQVIGVEGGTGWAGYRHLHFDVQKMPGDAETWKEILATPSLNGLSIPYKFQVKIKGKVVVPNSSEVFCKKEDMTQVPWEAP